MGCIDMKSKDVSKNSNSNSNSNSKINKQCSISTRQGFLSKVLINTSTYGLEYVIDEIFEEKARNKEITQDSAIDWFGLSDLTLE